MEGTEYFLGKMVEVVQNGVHISVLVFAGYMTLGYLLSFLSTALFINLEPGP